MCWSNKRAIALNTLLANAEIMKKTVVSLNRIQVVTITGFSSLTFFTCVIKAITPLFVFLRESKPHFL